MRKSLFAGALCLFAFSPPGLFGGVLPGTKGKEIIDEAVAALGGDQFLHLRTRVASGRVYAFFHDQLSGLDRATIISEYLEPKPGSGLAIQERELLGKKQDYSYLFLTDQGWDITFRGARPIPDENWERYVRTTEHDILYLLRERLNEPGMEFDYVSSEVYVSRHVEIVDITDAQNLTIRVYFDHNSHLPMRQIFNWMDPQTKERNEEISVYDKYRDIGQGVMWPFDIERERNGYKTYQFFADTAEANKPVPPKTFELPPGSKVLKKVN